MSNFARVRDFLATVQGPCPEGHLSPALRTSEIATGIGLPGEIRVAHWIGVMVRAGVLGRIKDGHIGRYYLARPVSDRKAMSREEALRRKNEREQRRHRARGGQTREQYRAKLAADRAAKEAEHARRQAERKAARANRARTPRVRAPKPATAAPRRLLVVPAGTPKPAPVVRCVTSDVATFLAEGGRIDILPPCTWSTPLRTATGA